MLLENILIKSYLRPLHVIHFEAVVEWADEHPIHRLKRCVDLNTKNTFSVLFITKMQHNNNVKTTIS